MIDSVRVEITIPPEQLQAAVAEAMRKQSAPLPATPKLSYKLREAAHATGMSVAWFRREIRNKRLKTIKLNRTVLIPADEVNRLLNKEPIEKAKDEESWSTNEEIFGGLSSSSMVN
jgi:hypothetical protein